MLIERYGEDQARAIVDYAYRVAPTTHFEIQSFGGILQYATDAIEANAAVGVVRRSEDYTDSPETLACVAALLAKRS